MLTKEDNQVFLEIANLLIDFLAVFEPVRYAYGVLPEPLVE